MQMPAGKQNTLVRYSTCVAALTAVVGCGESTNPPAPAALTLQSISPTDAPVSSPALTITLTGTGFPAGATVRWNGVVRPSTRVSSTTLTASIAATDLATAGEFAVTVRTADSATISAPQTFSVRNPIPVIDSLRSSSTPAFGDVDVILRGRGFVSTSVVRANGNNRLTIFGDTNTLRAVLTDADLALAGQIALTVANSAPGGGTTAATVFSVTNPLPQPSGLSPASAASGGPAFTLRVTGKSIMPGAVVTWNGSDRPTTYNASGAVDAAIPASDVTSTGVAQVRVRNLAPGGGTSSPLLFTVGTPARLDSNIAVATVDLSASFIVSDVSRSIVYAATMDSVVAFDATTGNVSYVVHIPGEARRLALADDGSYLYVNYTTLPSVRRINLATRVVDLTFDVGKNRFGNQLVAEDMKVVPGFPRSLVVARVSAFSPGMEGVGVYDNGVQRGAIAFPSEFSPLGSSRIVATNDPLVYYGFDDRTTEKGVREYRAGLAGMTVGGIIGGLVESANDIAFGFGRIFGTDGSVSLARAGGRQGFIVDGSICIDEPAGRVYVLRPDGGLRAYNPVSLELIGAVATPSGGNPVRWGADGFAYRTGRTIVFLRSTLVK